MKLKKKKNPTENPQQKNPHLTCPDSNPSYWNALNPGGLRPPAKRPQLWPATLERHTAPPPSPADGHLPRKRSPAQDEITPSNKMANVWAGNLTCDKARLSVMYPSQTGCQSCHSDKLETESFASFHLKSWIFLNTQKYLWGFLPYSFQSSLPIKWSPKSFSGSTF